MNDINKVIAHKLASIMQPAYGGLGQSKESFPIRNHVGKTQLLHVM